MRVLFINTNINDFNEGSFPFGLASIVSMTKSHDYWVDVNFVEGWEDYARVLNCVGDFSP